MQTIEQLNQEYDDLIEQGARLAGSLTDVGQRAAVYHHLFEDSGRNHIFPLIAAHGALWARGYFAVGMKLGKVLAWQFPWSSKQRREKLDDLSRFADAFREINRRVCVDTYASYHFTARYGDHPEAVRFVTPKLLAALNKVHSAKRNRIELPDSEKRLIFETHFLNEQQTVVGPRIQQALDEFQWPLAKRLSLSPVIRFAYFPKRTLFLFRHFDQTEERITNGLRAFDIAAEVGWDRVQSTLKHYNVLPSAFFTNSSQHFKSIKATVLQVSR